MIFVEQILVLECLAASSKDQVVGFDPVLLKVVGHEILGSLEHVAAQAVLKTASAGFELALEPSAVKRDRSEVPTLA